MADYQVAPGASFEYARQIGGVTGAAANLTIRIYDGPTDVTSYGPSGAGIVESVTNPGVYSAILTAPTVAGQYLISLKHATLGLISTAELIVSYTAAATSSPTGSDLCTVSDVRLYLQKATGETAQDGVIQAFITAASQMISDYCQRDLYPIASATYRFQVDGTLVPLDHDLRSVSTMTLDPDGAATVLTSSSYSLQPIGTNIQGTYDVVRLSNTLNLVSSRAVLFGYNELSILGAWGPAAIEPAVAHAAIITAGLWIRREVAARGILSSDLEVDSVDLQPRSIPGAALRALDPYRKLVVA